MTLTNQNPSTTAPDRRTPFARSVDGWLGRPSLDLFLAIGVVVAHAAASNLHGVWILSDVAPSERRLVYAALSGVGALAAGTLNGVIGSYVSATGAIVDQVRHRHGSVLRADLRSVSLWLWISVVATLICIVLDAGSQRRPHHTRGADWLAEFIFVLVALKFARLTMVQDLLLRANDLSHLPANTLPSTGSRPRFPG